MAMILDAFVGNLITRLSALVEEKVVAVLGVRRELQKLQRNMERINRVLRDAERKRIQSEVTAGWVKELEDVMYDADDIINLCRYEGGRLLNDQPSSSPASPPVCCKFTSLFSCFSGVRFRHEIGYKIKDLNARLVEIYNGVPALNLVQNEPDVLVTRVNPRQTSPVADSSDVVGTSVERAANDLAELIVGKDEQKCLVFAVTGMAGIGKTTLAQNIFNHQKIRSKFSVRIWVCISQKFSEIDLLKEMIRGAGGYHGDLQTIAELVPALRNVVSGKPCFLVLDDVWRADVWNGLLRTPLQSGSIGSRILVTTRDRNVAMQVGAVRIHPVEPLPVQFGWELLCKSAFVTDEVEMQNLREVGSQIVEKCHGLPLAIKTIGGVLTTKERSRIEWENFLRDTWSMDRPPDDLRGSLYLSYEDLPSPVKQCFMLEEKMNCAIMKE